MPESYSRHEPRDRSLRAGDRDRDAVADILREQHLAGRLQSDEFQERLDRCYEARSYRELDELVADLPRGEPVHSAPRPWHLPALAVLPLLIAAIALSGGRLLWLAIPLFLSSAVRFFGAPRAVGSDGALRAAVPARVRLLAATSDRFASSARAQRRGVGRN